MGDSTVKKVESARSPRGDMGQRHLVSGTLVSMRLWDEPPGTDLPASTRDYETVGFALSGEATLEIEGQSLTLRAGDSWLVPRGARHRYRVATHFRAVEATAPPAQVHGRDEPPPS